MAHTIRSLSTWRTARRRSWPAALGIGVGIGGIFTSFTSHASLFSGDTLDAVADVMAWVVIVIAPVIAIGTFLLIHILPEKIAEKRHHPQLSAIKTLCILSLFFGGLLWPLAWLWAYTKPVLHKMAYGTEVAESEENSSLAQPSSTGESEPMPRERDHSV